jgi:putative PIN family toxin of toxin-antitoxin system
MAKGLKDDTLQYFLNAIITNSTKINPSIHFEAIPEDPSDNIFLDCAVEGKADFIISGNTKHLGKLKSFQSIPILTPRQFLDQFHA